jgi:release factor glutamine methyltransferase
MQPKPLDQSKLRALIASGEYSLAEGPHPERARLDAESLLLHILRRSEPERDKAWLMAHWNSPTMPEVRAEMEALVERRKTGEPLQYITGSSEFFGLPFSVGPGVLIPRPETEHLVEEVLRLTKYLPSPRIADIGTGSGIIAVALANALPNAQITAIDLSPQALAIARENAALNHVESRITFLEGDLLAPLTGQLFDILASNPPYIPTADHDSLSVEVREYEPHSALFAGDDGMEVYHRLIPAAREHLIPNGWLILEIGYGQQPAMECLLQSTGYGDVHFIPDYQGIPRVACAHNP